MKRVRDRTGACSVYRGKTRQSANQEESSHPEQNQPAPWSWTFEPQMVVQAPPPMGSLFQQPQLTETLPERFQYPSKPTRERSAHWEEFVDVDLCWTGKYSSLSEVKKELPVRLSTATHSAWLLHVFLWPGLLQSVTSRGNKGKITLGVT